MESPYLIDGCKKLGRKSISIGYSIGALVTLYEYIVHSASFETIHCKQWSLKVSGISHQWTEWLLLNETLMFNSLLKALTL